MRGGFTFNVMCIGETGLGKSTLMDSLFNTSFESMPADHKSPDVKLKSRTYELEESSVRLNVSRSALMLDNLMLDHFRRQGRLPCPTRGYGCLSNLSSFLL